MANTIRDYSATAASNTTVDGADISEGCSPAGINNAIRGVMADLKDVSTGAVSLESPAADSLSLSGALTTTSTIDGRDVAADGTKLDTIESNANVTDAGNVNPLVDSHLNQSTAASGELLSWNGSDYDWIAAGGGGDLLAANNLSDVANAGSARSNLGLAIGSNVQAYSSVLAGTTASYTTALNTKLSGIEASADVTDTANVTAAGALMDSEVTNLAQVKAFSASDYATAAQGATADAALPKAGGAMTGAITSSSNGAIELDPNGSGKVTFKGNATRGAGQFVLNCENNSHGITVKGPPHSAGASYTLTLPNTDGAANEFLQTDGSGVLTWAAASGGGSSLDLVVENYDGSSTAPSATGTNAVAIGKGSVSDASEAIALIDGTASSQEAFAVIGTVYGSAIRGIAIGAASSVGGGGFAANYACSIGYQAKSYKTESLAIGKGYSAGTESLTVNISDSGSSYGANATNSIAMGWRSKATNTKAIAISGNQCLASGSQATSIGGENGNASGAYAVTLGGSVNTASGQASYAFGARAVAQQAGKYAFGAQIVTSGGILGFGMGATQGGMMILGASTTDATATILRSNNSAAGSTNQIVAHTDTCITFDGTITAMQNGAQAYASFKIEGLLVNDGGTTTLANSATTVIHNLSSWGMALSADNTNNALAITVTGEASHNIIWVANIRTSEVTFS